MFLQASSTTEAMSVMTWPWLSPPQQTLQRAQRSGPFYGFFTECQLSASVADVPGRWPHCPSHPSATTAVLPLRLDGELATRKILRFEQGSFKRPQCFIKIPRLFTEWLQDISATCSAAFPPAPGFPLLGCNDKPKSGGPFPGATPGFQGAK